MKLVCEPWSNPKLEVGAPERGFPNPQQRAKWSGADLKFEVGEFCSGLGGARSPEAVSAMFDCGTNPTSATSCLSEFEGAQALELNPEGSKMVAGG